jgi:hypothetical protein
VTGFGLAFVEEAVGASCDLRVLDGYLHLLAADLHSVQQDGGYRTAPLSSTRPCGYERWFRVHFDPPFTYIYALKFWVPNLALPAGWQIGWGVAADYQQPTNAPSSIAVHDLPTSEPEAANFAVRSMPDDDGVGHSPWAVLQARLVGEVPAGAAMVERGPESEVPVLIEYHLDWSEG